MACQKQNDEKQIKPSVYIVKENSGFKLIRNGKPYYIKGGAAHPDFLEELKEAGANTARIYDTINLSEILDKAHDLGLAVAVDIPLPQYVNNPQYFEDDEYFIPMKQRVERVVKQHKDHPALLYWNLGNELFYPYFYKNTKFFSNFNTLIDLIKELDPNHPVSTVTIGANRVRILSIHRKSPKLDFISSNSFGSLSEFEKRINPLSLVWQGPHVISEWGVNGSWEARKTSWEVPIEESSTFNAEVIKQRYYEYMEPLIQNNSLGHFIFYWGQKNENTPTWFSLFRWDGMKTQSVFELQQIWNNNNSGIYPGPKIHDFFLNGKRAKESIILLPGMVAEAQLVLPTSNPTNLEYKWEIRKESWYKDNVSEEIEIENLLGTGSNVTFTTPLEEGPYRIFIYITNGTEYFATANIPFYVLNNNDGI
ncbi:glycoside hydrolase family 2 TIM barrel-domain containing protein [soil metagenome]